MSEDEIRNKLESIYDGLDNAANAAVNKTKIAINNKNRNLDSAIKFAQQNDDSKSFTEYLQDNAVFSSFQESDWKELQATRDPVGKFKQFADRDISQAESSMTSLEREIKRGFLPSTISFVLEKTAVLDQETAKAAIPQLAKGNFTVQDFEVVRDFVKAKAKQQPASEHEARRLMFQMLSQIHLIVEKRNGYALSGISHPFAIVEAAQLMESGQNTDGLEELWLSQFSTENESNAIKRTAWLLARQCGVTDLNLKRMVEEMTLQDKFVQNELGDLHSLNFFNPADLTEATLVWQRIVEQRFPLEVFTLEPQVEEQNLLDSNARIREMQIALAMNVAQGTWNAGQKVSLARQLARESSAIGVNRTAVGFVHGSDTFGWYFHPRAQAAQTLVNNRTAFRQTIFPASMPVVDDRSSHRLEPGVRECEVLVAMPNFVSRVEFDVTTNWESLKHPGKSKNSYEELVCQGSMLQQARDCLCPANFEAEYREGDISRLSSRVDQLENMLSLQTIGVDIPYENDQSATDLFDQSDDVHVPEIYDYYGLDFLVADEKIEAEFFVTGKNFHPTLTHVVVGGFESHSLGQDATLEIISRELMKVSAKITTDKMSDGEFRVRVGTPAGLSNPIAIAAPEKASNRPPESDFDWDKSPKYTAVIADGAPGSTESFLYSDSRTGTEFKVVPSSKNPFQLNKFLNQTSSLANIVQVYSVEFKDKTKQEFHGTPVIITTPVVTDISLMAAIKADLDAEFRSTWPREGKIVATTYFRLDEYSYVKFGKQITIELKKKQVEECKPVAPVAAPAIPVAAPAVSQSAPPRLDFENQLRN